MLMVYSHGNTKQDQLQMQAKSYCTFQRFGSSLRKGNDCLWDGNKGERRWLQKTCREMGKRMWKEGSCLIAFVWKVDDGIFCTVRFSMCVPWCAESFQFSCSVVSNSLWLHEPQHTSLPVHHQLSESTKTHVHWVGDAIQPSHPLSSPSPSAPNPSPHQSLFQWVNSSHEVAKVLEFQL